MWSERSNKIKTVFVVTALLIAAASLFYSHRLTRSLYSEEVNKMGVWAEAMRTLTTADAETDLNLVLEVINSNHSIPVVVTDENNHILTYRNLSPTPSGSDSIQTLEKETASIKAGGEKMQMNLSVDGTGSEYIYIYYKESYLLRRLTIFPYIQLSIVLFFFLLAIVALLAAKRAEQNKVWVGLSRETAHQLGTPISSLMAWTEVLRESYPHDELLPEMDKDVKRLQLIADRFSKIGSAPEMKWQDLCPIVEQVAQYYDRRTSERVVFSVELPSEPLPAMVNAPLFEWVIENLCKNAVDAMEGRGHIHISLTPLPHPHKKRKALILVSDTGKGIARSKFKTVFRPGFTTKKRGWGLGLSLAKRIVEEYHHGHIYVQGSVVGEGTTFAIEV